MHDYEETLGIAHFLEHMLFMGSERYPDVDYFSSYISQHAGEDNGETDEGYQSYYFDISSDYLADALDMYVTRIVWNFGRSCGPSGYTSHFSVSSIHFQNGSNVPQTATESVGQ